MTQEQTAEDRAWFAEEVNVEIEQDNRAWLDSLLDMKKDEMLNYGIYNYGLPAAVAEASTRHDLISLIVMANRGGGGQAVSRVEYMYVPELKGVLNPAVAMREPSDDPLFLTRGKGDARQIYDMTTKSWKNLAKLRAQYRQNKLDKLAAGDAADDAGATATEPNESSVNPNLLLPILPTLKRNQLNELAVGIGIEDAADEVKYVDRKALISAIESKLKGV